MSREVENIQSLIKNKDFNFRDFRLTGVHSRKNEEGAEELVLEGVPCVFDSETVLYKGKYWEFREIIDSNAFENADMSDVIFNFNHGGRVYARTRNNSLNLEVKKDGLHMRATLMPEDNGHQELVRDIKSGLIDKMSFAFTVKSEEYRDIVNNEGPNVEIRTITAIDKLYDVSAVDIPAYDATEISARKAFDSEREKRESERAKAESLARANYEYIKAKAQ